MMGMLQSAIQNAPDLGEVGRVAAQLTDWQTITYFLMVLILGQALERTWYATGVRKERRDMIAEREQMRQDMIAERERMWGVSEKFGDAADKLGDQLNHVITEIKVQSALNARLESVVTASEERARRHAPR